MSVCSPDSSTRHSCRRTARRALRQSRKSLTVDQLQRGRGNRREHHVAQHKRDVRDADAEELQRLAPSRPPQKPFECVGPNSARTVRTTNERRPTQIRRDDVVVVVVVGGDAAHGQIDVERKHGQRRDPPDRGVHRRSGTPRAGKVHLVWAMIW